MNICTLEDTEFENKFELRVESSGILTSVAGYFDTFFDDSQLDNKVIQWELNTKFFIFDIMMMSTFKYML